MKSATPVRALIAMSLAGLAVTAAGAATEASAQTITYTVTVSRPQLHLFEVEMQVSGASRQALDVSMPVWTPGSYLVREYERHVIRFAASDDAGQPLAWQKIDKNTWRIQTGGAQRVLVDYEVYAREPGIRWSFVYDEGGHVLGTNLFMYAVGMADLPVSAKFVLPEGWRLEGAIAPAPDDPYFISARSYHELIDAPMLIGDFDQIAFDVEGVPHVIAILGPNNADLERLSRDFAGIIEASSRLFDGLPYDRYAFIFLTLTGGGGIEHADGTTIGLGGLDFENPDSYRRVLGITSHEYFHAWNVKRIQPPAFKPYDYEAENYTDALWFYEGFTSYYGGRILRRAGLTDSDDDPVELVTSYRSTPGRTNQSAADASFNAWIHRYRSDESTPNYRVDYYLKGRVIANLLEIEIAHRTEGARGLDDVMRLMWRRTREDGATFDSQDIRAISEQVAGSSFKEFFDRYVYGTDEIPFEAFFELAGYALLVDEEATRQRDRAGYLGIRNVRQGRRLRIEGIEKGSPAWKHGLNYGDEIISIDGIEVTSMQSLARILNRYGPGREIEFRVLRFGGERRISVTLGRRSLPVYRLVEIESPTESQLAVRRRWRR